MRPAPQVMPKRRYSPLGEIGETAKLQDFAEVAEGGSPCLAANCRALVPFLVLLFTESPARKQPCHKSCNIAPDGSQSSYSKKHFSTAAGPGQLAGCAQERYMKGQLSRDSLTSVEELAHNFCMTLLSSKVHGIHVIHCKDLGIRPSF